MPHIPLRLVPTDLASLLSGAVEVMRAQAEQQQIDLHVEASGDVAHVTVDPEKIAWAVTTLVGNALRFVKHGTRLLPGGSIIVRLARDVDGIAITVEDDGPGIPPAKVPWLFERAPGTVHAAGLGLMLVRDVVVAHGGGVEVKSETEGPDRGTRIRLELPNGLMLS